MADLNDADRELLQEITDRFDSAENHRRPYVDRWDRLWQQYVLYNDFKRSYQEAAEPDRDAILRDGQQVWGANLRTPWAFATVETLVPRMVAHRPRMLVLPRRKSATPGVNVDDNAENMRFLIDSQQEQIEYDLKLQTTIKTGLIYGIGVQKSGWRLEECVERALKEKRPGSGVWREGLTRYTKFDDPDVEDLDIWDFFWDPYASDRRGLEYAFHRAWRSTRYVKDRLATSWSYTPLEDEDLLKGGAAQKYTEAHTQRMQAEGVSSGWKPRDEDIHEVWEFHDGREVVTVLDRQWIVQRGKNPYWHGELPFYCYRPSERPHRFVGTGAIEPIEHLIAEMDTLRSQRRDGAALRLNPPIFFNEGLVDPDDVVFGPGIGVPVNGDPRDVLQQAQIGDIPNSGYQEEAALKADIERATGISDPVQGISTGAAQTATGVQLVQQAASERIKLMTRRAEVELIAPCARHFGRMNQQKIRANREIPIPSVPEPDQPDRRWTWRVLSPGELQGDFVYVCEGGSTEPENVPQMRNDFNVLGQLQNHPSVDQRKFLIHRLKLVGISEPEEFLMPDNRISTKVLDVLKQRMIGSPDIDDDAPLLLNSEEGPREAHPQEADEIIEQIVQEVEQMEQAEAEQQQMEGGQQAA